MRRAFAALALLGACVPHASTLRAPPPAAAPFADSELRVQAARARERAAHEQADGAPGVFRQLQLRAQSEDHSVVSGVVLNLERPWHMSALSRSLREGEHAAALLADAAQREAEALACEESVRAHGITVRNALAQSYAAALASTLSWVEAFGAQTAVDAPTLAHDELLVRRKLLEAAPVPQTYRVHPTLGALPDVAEAQHGVLDLDFEHMVAGIEATHPKVRAELAEAARQGQLAVAESRSRTPWVDFLQLNVRAHDTGREELEARVAFGIPLDDGSRGRARRAEALRGAATLEALSVARTLAWSARAALVELDSIERHATDYRELERAAERASALAARLLEQRHGTPSDLTKLLDQAQAARMAVLDARVRAGLAACSLRFTNGTDYERWPRIDAPDAPSAAREGASAKREMP